MHNPDPNDFSMADERDISRAILLSQERRHELLKKIEFALKKLKIYKVLLSRKKELSIKEKLELAQFQHDLNLKNFHEIENRIKQLKKYQEKLDIKETREPMSTQETGKITLTDILKAIDDKGNVKLRDFLKKTSFSTEVLGKALFYAVENDNTNAVHLLLQANADPNFKNAKGESVLLEAVRMENESIIEALLQNHADPNFILELENGGGYPILFQAISTHSTPVVRLLLNNGADPKILNRPSSLRVGDTEVVRSALDVALKNQYSDIVKLLKETKKKSPYDRIYDKFKMASKAANILGINPSIFLQYPDGRSVRSTLSGGFNHLTIPWLTDYLSRYCKKLDDDTKLEAEKGNLSQHNHVLGIFNKIRKAFTLESRRQLLDPEVTMDEVLEAYERGDFVSIAGGWYVHTVGVALYKANMGFVNRGGAAFNPNAGTGVFPLEDSKKINAQVLQNSLSDKTDGKKVMENIVNFAMKDQNGKPNIEYIQTKMQKWGNCGFANTKPLVEIFLYWAYLEQGHGLHAAKRMAQSEYKKFTRFIRDRMCEELVSYYEKHPEDRALFEILFAEIIRKTAMSSFFSRYPSKKSDHLDRVALLIQAMDITFRHFSTTF